MMLSNQKSEEGMAFLKMHGAGNDFIMIDIRNKSMDLTPDLVARFCDRHFGIGADGLLGLTQDGGSLKMHYYNADGFPGSFCGNGGRCFAFFACWLGLVEENVPFTFLASDGWHTAHVLSRDRTKANVVLDMQPVRALHPFEKADQVDTGSPHLVFWPEEALESFDVTEQGRKWRYHPAFAPKGINVNFAWRMPDETLVMRTFERGVEAETLACGTGTVAVALSAFSRYSLPSGTSIAAAGGTLKVDFSFTAEGFSNIKLTGPAEILFSGQWKDA